MTSAAASATIGPFAPFRRRAFVLLWGAALIANTGTWIRDVANGWTMTELASSSLMVALVQSAVTLPVFLLSLPAGALGDIFDRRRMLLAIQVLLIAVSLSLAAATYFGVMTAPLLLALTFAGGVGFALQGPTWQAVVAELVPRAELNAAVALNSTGINVARAIGPALGGLVLATSGALLAYLIDAASYLAVIAALLLWRRTPGVAHGAPERFAPAIAAGVRYVLLSADVKRVLLRSAVFFLFASAYWALLPLVARQQLGGDASLYGALLGAVGAGAVTGALLLPTLRRGRSGGTVVLAGTLLTAAAMAALALSSSGVVAFIALFIAGAAWIAVLTTLNVTMQTALPDWVRARGLAIYLTVFFGAMTLGSAIWGQVATVLDVPASLLVAAVGAALIGVVAAAAVLPQGDADLTPSMHWPAPIVIGTETRGPVLIEIAYEIAPTSRAAFLSALNALGRARRRDGALDWGVYEDEGRPGHFTEIFFAATWRDHLRQHERITHADAALQAAVDAFHIGPEPKRVRHLVGAQGN
ncbi:MAG: MFS transporter [Alphaproteobacteria bacterium]|nr:MAG: MFS transporter [Alphaproteobacteria bacterium]